MDSNHRTLPRTDLQSVAIAAMRLPRYCCPTTQFSKCRSRADEGTRTPDRLITNQLLYQLSYIGFCQPFKQLFFSSIEVAKILLFSNTAKVFFKFFSKYSTTHCKSTLYDLIFFSPIPLSHPTKHASCLPFYPFFAQKTVPKSLKIAHSWIYILYISTLFIFSPPFFTSHIRRERGCFFVFVRHFLYSIQLHMKRVRGSGCLIVV